MKTIRKTLLRPIYSIDHRLSSRLIQKKRNWYGLTGTIENPTEIIHIPPDCITHQCESEEIIALRRCKSLLFKQTIYREGNIAGGDWDLQRKCYEENHHYNEFKERFIEKKPWEETSLYERYKNKLVKRDDIEWSEFKARYLKQWDQLFIDIKTKGFKSNYELTGKLHKEVVVCVSRSGEIMRPPMGGGNHRFAIAKILELKEIPVVVSVWHKQYIDWLKKHLAIKHITPRTAIRPVLEGMKIEGRRPMTDDGRPGTRNRGADSSANSEGV